MIKPWLLCVLITLTFQWVQADEEYDTQDLNIQISPGNLQNLYSRNNNRKEEGEEKIISELSHLAKDTHVIQFQKGHLLYTLLPVKDTVFNDKRKEAFQTSVELGKIVLKEWLMQAAKLSGLVKNKEEALALLETLEIINTKSDQEIQAILKKGRIPKMPDKYQIIQESKQLSEVRDKLKQKQKDIDKLEKLVREIDGLEDEIVMPNGEGFSFKKVTERLFPAAFITTVGIKMPKRDKAFNPPYSGYGPLGDSGNFFLRTLNGLINLISGNSTTLTFIHRPWIKHVRNLDTNEITTSTADPRTWHWEHSAQAWIQKDANPFEKATTNESAFPRLRAGAGILFSRDITNLSEIKGAFSGASFTKTIPSQLNAAMPLSANVKVGAVVPFENITAANLSKLFDYVYVIGSLQRGIPVQKTSSWHGNIGAIVNLTEFFGFQTIPVSPLPIYNRPGTIGQPGGGAPVFPGTPGVNPVIDFRPGGPPMEAPDLQTAPLLESTD